MAAQNGVLYNHAAIRDGLAAAATAFASHCDTEILPHLYESHGTFSGAEIVRERLLGLTKSVIAVKRKTRR